MPRTINEILANADELAARFEAYDPKSGDEMDHAALNELREAVAERAAVERRLLQAVRHARQAGLTWSVIGELAGTTGEAARQRYGRIMANG